MLLVFSSARGVAKSPKEGYRLKDPDIFLSSRLQTGGRLKKGELKMTNTTFTLPEELHRYLLSVSLREHPVLAELREATASHPESNMQIAPEQGQLMALLAHLLGARKYLEVGVFTGYSSLVMALALPEDGRVVACDTDEAAAQTARSFWKRAGVEGKIELMLGPAIRSLEELAGSDERETFDCAFIDADKENQHIYFELLLGLVRPGGLIMVDNTLWKGKVAQESQNDPETAAIRDFNQRLAKDRRVELSLVPIGDGLTLARKL